MLLESPEQVQDGDFRGARRVCAPFRGGLAAASHGRLAACIGGPVSLGCAPLRRTPRRGRPATRP
jgi:hypothetical protein